MKMEDSSEPLKPHCLVLSYPTQGHLNPMLQFSRRLLHKGVKVTLVTAKSMSKTQHGLPSGTWIVLEAISDGFDHGGIGATGSPKAYIKCFSKVGRETLSELVGRLISSSPPTTCIVYDSFLPWALDVAHKFGGLVGAAFFTMSCAVNSVFYHYQKGRLEVPVKKQALLHGMPPLEPQDMPSFAYDVGSYPAFSGMLVKPVL